LGDHPPFQQGRSDRQFMRDAAIGNNAGTARSGANSCRSPSKLGGAKILGQVKLNRLSWRQLACSIKGVGTQATTSSACQIEQVQISLALPAMSFLCGVRRQSIGS
jgi:hypothetical protein